MLLMLGAPLAVFWGCINIFSNSVFTFLTVVILTMIGASTGMAGAGNGNGGGSSISLMELGDNGNNGKRKREGKGKN